MDKKGYTDEDIVAGLTASGKKRDTMLKAIYLNKELKGYVIGFVRNNGGNHQDGLDIFQDAIILLDRRVREGGFNGSGSINGYLQGIARRLWLRKRSQWNEKTEELNEENQKEDIEDSPEIKMIAAEKLQAIEDILEKLGEKCQKLLRLYKLEQSMDEIAQAMGFSGKDVAKNEAYRCRQKFRSFVKEREYYIDLLEITSE